MKKDRQKDNEKIFSGQEQNDKRYCPPPEQTDSIHENRADGKPKGRVWLSGRRQLRHPNLVKVVCAGLLVLLLVGAFTLQDNYFSWNLAELTAGLQSAGNDEDAVVQAGADFDFSVQPVYDEAPLLPQEDEESQAVDASPGAQTVDQSSEQATEVSPAAAKVSAAYDASWEINGDMTILREYGYSYDPTWQDYRFHSGIDLAMAEGAAAPVLIDGTIKEIGESRGMGQYVRVEQGDLECLYYGLAVDESWQTGASVKAGDILGTITASPLNEYNEVPHLHFELSTADGTLDPKDSME